jgi:hypothetical protein
MALPIIVVFSLNIHDSHGSRAFAQNAATSSTASADRTSSNVTSSGETTADSPGADAPGSDETNSVGTVSTEEVSELDKEDIQRIEKFSRAVPPRLKEWLPNIRGKNRHYTPVLSFKHWASERKRFFPSFMFCFFAGLIGVAFFPKQIAVAQQCCTTRFWSCLGRSILILITLLISVIVLDRLVITAALATLLVAILELILIAGLAVGVSVIGERVVDRTGLAKMNFFISHPRFATFTKILIGSLIIALIVQIPGLGKLPRIGIRIATLIAILGAGGLLKTRFGTQSQTSSE